jgi:hypothetical protein
MCICNSETSGDPIELILFPKAYATFKDKIKMGTPILVSGKVVMGEKFSLAADNIDLI